MLFLQGLEFLRHLRLHAAILLPPAVIGLLGDLHELADFGNSLALAKLHLGATQLGDHLIHRVSFLLPLK